MCTVIITNLLTCLVCDPLLKFSRKNHSRRKYDERAGIEREARCVCLVLPVGLVSLQQLSISMSLLACVCLTDDCRVNNCASVGLASGSIRKTLQCTAHNWTN